MGQCPASGIWGLRAELIAALQRNLHTFPSEAISEGGRGREDVLHQRSSADLQQKAPHPLLSHTGQEQSHIQNPPLTLLKPISSDKQIHGVGMKPPSKGIQTPNLDGARAPEQEHELLWITFPLHFVFFPRDPLGRRSHPLQGNGKTPMDFSGTGVWSWVSRQKE